MSTSTLVPAGLGPTLILQPWCLLLVAEKADLKTIAALKLTNKWLYSIIQAYEQSLYKALAATFILPPVGSVQSTDINELPRLIKGHTFSIISELEVRDYRMDLVLNDGFLSFGTSKGDRLRYACKRGLYIADHLGDFEAELTYPAAGTTGIGYPMIYGATNKAQASFLRSLPTLDLAFLYEVVARAGEGYRRWKGHKHGLEHSPQLANQVTVFKETIMRKGSFILFMFVRGNGEAAGSLVQSYMNTTHCNIEWYRKGIPGALPSLHHILEEELGKRIVEGWENEKGLADFQGVLDFAVREVIEKSVG